MSRRWRLRIYEWGGFAAMAAAGYTAAYFVREDRALLAAIFAAASMYAFCIALIPLIARHTNDT